MGRPYQPTTDPKFLETLQQWFLTQSEILVEIRYRAGAGSKDFEFYLSYEALSDMMRGLPQGACITVFKQPQLPLRGVVEDNFIATCLNGIPDGVEYLMVETVLVVYGRMSWFHHGSGTTHAELRDDLEESRGKPVAVGVHPPVFAETDEVIAAVVPDEDGVVRAGPY